MSGQREAAAQRQRAVLPLREDRAHAERTADLLADDHTAERRRHHDGRSEIARAVRERRAERLRVARMLQDERALQIARTVQPRGQTEMPVEQRARSPEEIKKLVARHASSACRRTA